MKPENLGRATQLARDLNKADEFLNFAKAPGEPGWDKHVQLSFGSYEVVVPYGNIRPAVVKQRQTIVEELTQLGVEIDEDRGPPEWRGYLV